MSPIQHTTSGAHFPQAQPADLARLRQSLKQQRRTLSRQAVQAASQRVCQQLQQQPAFLRARRIAAYVGSHGEIDPMPLLHQAHALGKQCYLPVLHPFLRGRLWFVPWSPRCAMRPNRYQIDEPIYLGKQACPAQFLDWILVPLLGFDVHGHRLGMGGGYYDRTLAFRLRRTHWQGPRLVGLAHEFQRVDNLQTQAWDIDLDAVITDRHCYRASSPSTCW